MEKLILFITENAAHAHWFVFGAILLAGLNIPLSIDLLAISSAVLAASVIPEHTLFLFLSVFLGCCFSAWIAYWFGRGLGPKLLNFRYFKKLLTEQKLQKINNFYKKYGFLTLLVGRFIPFGVRNCIFMSTGISRFPFKTFIIRDCIACFVWSSTMFSLFYLAGQNYLALFEHMKLLLLLLLGALSMTIIGVIWYKRRKTGRANTNYQK